MTLLILFCLNFPFSLKCQFEKMAFYIWSIKLTTCLSLQTINKHSESAQDKLEITQHPIMLLHLLASLVIIVRKSPVSFVIC